MMKIKLKWGCGRPQANTFQKSKKKKIRKNIEQVRTHRIKKIKGNSQTKITIHNNYFINE